jgi:hypothetical protein
MEWWIDTQVFNTRHLEIEGFLREHCGHGLYESELEIFETGIHMKFPNLETATLFKLKFS